MRSYTYFAISTLVTEGLKMLPEAAGRGQHFHARGHSFSPYGPTLSWQKHVYFFPALNWFAADYCLRRLCTVPYFSVRSYMSIVESDGPPSWSLDASETGESTK